jgi:hypothetical protein
VIFLRDTAFLNKRESFTSCRNHSQFVAFVHILSQLFTFRRVFIHILSHFSLGKMRSYIYYKFIMRKIAMILEKIDYKPKKYGSFNENCSSIHILSHSFTICRKTIHILSQNHSHFVAKSFTFCRVFIHILSHFSPGKTRSYIYYIYI